MKILESMEQPVDASVRFKFISCVPTPATDGSNNDPLTDGENQADAFGKL